MAMPTSARGLRRAISIAETIWSTATRQGPGGDGGLTRVGRLVSCWHTSVDERAMGCPTAVDAPAMGLAATGRPA